MRISFQNVKGQGSATVDGLGVFEGKVEPLFIVRGGDPRFEETLEFYLGKVGDSWQGAGKLAEKMAEGRRFPKHRCDGKVEEKLGGAVAIGLDLTGSGKGPGLLHVKTPIAPDLSAAIDELLETVNTGGPGVLFKIQACAKKIEEAMTPEQ